MNDIIPLRTIRPDLPFAVAAYEVITAHIASLWVWSVFLPREECQLEHHMMRIAVKRLRYSLEVFADLLPEATTYSEDLHGLQDVLGELHDLDVFANSVQDELRRLKNHHISKRHEALRSRAAEKRTSLEALSGVTQEDRHARYLQCVMIWQSLIDRDFFMYLRQQFATVAGLAQHSAAMQQSFAKESPL